MKDNTDDKKENYMKRYKNASLYSWFSRHITNPIINQVDKVIQVGYSYVREDGNNIGYDIAKTIGKEEDFSRLIRSRIEKVITAIKSSNLHERSYFHLSYDFIDEDEENNKVITTVEKFFWIIRFDNEKYEHETLGTKEKHIITVIELPKAVASDYLKHIQVCSIIHEMNKSYDLSIFTSEDTRQLSLRKIQTIEDSKADDDLDKLYIHRSMTLLRELNTYIKVNLTDDYFEKFREMRYLGSPNYSVNTDNTLRIYTKNNISKSHGNGNANWFDLDPDQPILNDLNEPES